MNPHSQVSVTGLIYFSIKLIYMRLKPGIKVNFLDDVQDFFINYFDFSYFNFIVVVISQGMRM